MELLHPLETNKNLLFYTTEARLYARPLQNEHLGRPTLLCSNYESGLSSTLYHDIVYYSYINKEHSLLVRSLTEPAVLFRLDCTAGVSYRMPKLVVFNKVLLLFYFEQHQSTYNLKAHALFTDTQPHSFPTVFPEPLTELPELTLCATASYLYVLLTGSQVSNLFRYDTSFSFEPFLPEAEVLSSIEQKKQELQTIKQLLTDKDRENTTIRHLLTERTQEVENSKQTLMKKSREIEDIKTLFHEQSLALEHTKLLLNESKQETRASLLRLSESEKALQHTGFLLERAKTQYNELMQVAEKYREEAVKWYSKFTDRH